MPGSRSTASREVPSGPWRYTDDTEMALSIVETLELYDEIDQDGLARAFARRMEDDRGYGAGTFKLLQEVRRGAAWKQQSAAGFRGMGSFGNGAAMRVAPLGAFFADRELSLIAEQARLSAEVTHMHPEGIAGAIAIAVGAALAWRAGEQSQPLGTAWIEQVRAYTPAGFTRDAIDEALALPATLTLAEAGAIVGNGSGVSAPDTVPLCLLAAARWSNDFGEAMWRTVSALGDRDTTCAIVGGMVALSAGASSIPSAWLARRETLPI